MSAPLPLTPWKRFVDRLGRPRKPRRRNPIRLVCFDLDGVLLEARSSWVTVHDHFGVANEASLRAFLKGEIDDDEFIRRDVALWLKARPDLRIDEIEHVLAKGARLVRGALATVRALQKAGVECAIVSGGIDLTAVATAERLGITRVSANGLTTDAHGRLTGAGVVRTPLGDKGAPVRRFARELGVPLGAVASVGNSGPDIAMFRVTALGIAFQPEDEFTIRGADVKVEGNDLRAILPHILPKNHRAAPPRKGTD